MPRLPSRIIASTLCCLLWYGAGASAQSGPPKALRLSQAERMAIELRQGMTLKEVEKLLGKPRRTALRADAYGGSREASPGTLQWTYSWPGATEPQRTLRVNFASNAPERWLVSGWDWESY